jgi:hypothetical protein
MFCEQCSALERQIRALQTEVWEQTEIRDVGFSSLEQEHECKERLEEKLMLLHQAQVIYRSHLVRVHNAS